MEVKVQRDTKVIISLSEEEAGKLRAILFNNIDFEQERWAEEVHDALMTQGVLSKEYHPL